MSLESRKHLYDIRQACRRPSRFTAGKRFEQYQHDELLQAAVERQVEIIGEAMGRLVRTDPETATSIPEHKAILAFRHRVIHGYDTVDHAIVWGIVQNRIPSLHQQVATLLAPSEG